MPMPGIMEGVKNPMALYFSFQNPSVTIQTDLLVAVTVGSSHPLRPAVKRHADFVVNLRNYSPKIFLTNEQLQV